MTTDNTHTTISGPAVDFDTAALRSWLAEPTRNDTDRASELGIDEFFGRGHGHLLSGLRDLLAALSDKQSVWRLRPGIEHVVAFVLGVMHPKMVLDVFRQRMHLEREIATAHRVQKIETNGKFIAEPRMNRLAEQLAGMREYQV